MDIAKFLEMPRQSDETATVPSGFADLDDLVGGLKPGRLWLVTSTPGQGRTTLLTQWAGGLAVTQSWMTVLMCPRETPERCASRLIAGLSGVLLARVVSGAADAFTNDDVRQAEVALRKSKFAVLTGQTFPSLSEAHPLLAYVIDDADLVAECSPQHLRSLADEGALVIASLPRHVLVEGKELDADLAPAWARAADLILELRTHATRGIPGYPPYASLELSILKNRDGPLMDFAAVNQCHLARFHDLFPDKAPET